MTVSYAVLYPGEDTVTANGPGELVIRTASLAVPVSVIDSPLSVRTVTVASDSRLRRSDASKMFSTTPWMPVPVHVVTRSAHATNAPTHVLRIAAMAVIRGVVIVRYLEARDATKILSHLPEVAEYHTIRAVLREDYCAKRTIVELNVYGTNTGPPLSPPWLYIAAQSAQTTRTVPPDPFGWLVSTHDLYTLP